MTTDFAPHQPNPDTPPRPAPSVAESFQRLAALPLPQLAETIARAMGVDQWEIDRRKAFLEFTERDAELLRALHGRLRTQPSAFADAFYKHLFAFEETRKFLTDPATVERLKHSQAAYFESLTAGRYGMDYAQHRIRVGAAHHRIGLGPTWYLGAYNKYLTGLMAEAWSIRDRDPQTAIDTITALVRIVLFDIGLTLDTYHHIDRWTIADLQTHAQRIVANIPSGVLVLSADLRVLFANRAFLEIVGLPAERVTGMPLEAFFPGVGWWDLVARVLGAGDAPCRVDVDASAKRGTRHLQITLATIVSAGPEIGRRGPDQARLLVVVDDVTERRQAEDALRESQRSLSTLISNLQGMVYRCRNDREWTVEYVSQGALALTGYPPEDFVERRVAYGSLIHPEDQELVWDGVQRGVDAQRPFELVYRIRTAGGAERWVWEQGRGVFSDRGELLALEGFVTDITARKWAEEALGLIVRDTGSLVGEPFFRSLTRNMAAALRVRWAFISTLADPEGRRVRLLAFWTGDDHGDTFEYAVKGTPCEQVVARNLQYFPDNVQALFPEDAWLREQGVASYLAIPLFDSTGRPLGHMGVMDDRPMDVTIPMESILRIFAARAGAEIERQQAEQALRDSEERYRNLIENAHDMIQSVAPDGRFLFVNRAWMETMGYGADEVRALTLVEVIAPQSRAHCQHVFERILAGSSAEFVQAEFVAKDGRTVLVEGSVTARYTEGRLVATHAIFRNITERREWEARLDHVTSHDPLTDLPNRAVFMDRLSQALVRVRKRRGGRPLAVLLLDLDRFKLVNETLGHASGDRLLATVAQRLTACLRDGDTVARFGGDEFAVLLPEIAKASDMVIVVDKIFAAFRSAFVVDGHEIFMTTSIGISIAPDDADEAGVLLRNADAAMYRAKDQGRNTYQLYSPAMNVSTLERLSLDSSLRHALEREEFLVHYQPQVDLGTGRIVGVEALVRWQHPEWGVVSPARFIPLAEETGLIVPIGERVLRAACAQNRAWQDQGIAPFPVSVNLSARQFQQPDLKAMVARVLREADLDPRWLELELTESLLMEDADRTIATLGELRAMGIRLAMDDFGIGYSSLSYLKRFPINTIKIDQSFVRHVTSDADDAAIATAIIAMAHSLNLTVVAEGVETDEQLAFLTRQRCDVIQGYLVSPPRPAEDLTPLLRAARGGDVRPFPFSARRAA